MTAVAVYACPLERIEGLVFARDPERSRVGDPERFYDRVYAERALGTLDDAEQAEATLRQLLLGPAPEAPLGRTHAIVLRSIVETLCARIDDDAFGAMALSEARAWALSALGAGLAGSLEGRRLPFLKFEESLHSPVFSYWTRDEIRGFLERYEAALSAASGDVASSDRLRHLQGVWRSALAQGPDALLVITL